MRIHYHIVTGYLDPARGGMEQSIARTIGFFHGFGDCAITVYTRFEDGEGQSPADSVVEVVSLAARRARLVAPMGDASRRERERYRCDFLFLSEEIQRRMDINPSANHLIVSFYITGSGFLAQQVADSLCLRHIACARGSDLNRDFRSPRHFPAILHVLNRASHVITSNAAMERAIRPFVGRGTSTTTIYNSLPDELMQMRWSGKAGKGIQLIADCGSSSKKGTHILTDAVVKLIGEGFPIRLSVIGKTENTEKEYWDAYWDRIPAQDLCDLVTRREQCSRENWASLLRGADIYCSASLGEGCCNSTILAMTMGVPIVATSVGVLPEMVNGNARHVRLVPPGNVDQFADALRNSVCDAIAGRTEVANTEVEKWRNVFSTARERNQWERVVREMVPRRHTIKSERQKRVLFFVHDGTGLGHLKRLSRLGSAIQGPCASLMVTGHWSASAIVPEAMEFVHLPSFDSLLPNKASYWGRKPFLSLSREDARAFRAQMLEHVISDFDPDAIVVDYLPLGHHSELHSVINNSCAKKYFIMRGVLDVPGNVRMDLLWGEAEAALANKYDRLLVAGDRRICDVAKEYDLKSSLTSKMEYIGYVSTPVPPHERERVRHERGIGPRDKWVVCSAGGGAIGEELISECELLPAAFPNVEFDIVYGPRANTPWPFLSGDIYVSANVRFMRAPRSLDKLHGSADVVITSGGYNSMMEAMEGGARLICSPAQRREGGEQVTHAQRLSRYYPITFVSDHAQIRSALTQVLEATVPPPKIHQALDLRGISRFKEIVLEDLGFGLSKCDAQGVCQ
jgi:predicted glycosyltransferase/glycosyltransferase involved in cell wall biosynthesis